MTDEEIQRVITDFDLLADSFLDQFEKKTFGKTLKEMDIETNK